ncbi:ubiquitin carboxyl-terminal hydrolase 16 [Corylus avellana]|uniref:ubiquitin carboxyl-terminal hydrolase 16 n=1 Tax=Corylus avellana TaxID=13451 RepID=UPI00286A3373|nr:ubiquitin carboxyl-terminal hydrolase 16 [Corylus avellana]
MRDTGYYLGFRGLVLLFACVVAPVIGFLIRRKWRLAVTRNEEIKRLLALAAEEAARAELEASAGYSASSASSAVPISTTYHQCAVCYSPTTTRCSRCKAVRYCSGKCQIIHWRQGHREDCHPASNTHRISDVGSKLTERDNHESNDDSFETEGRRHAYPIKTFPGEPALSKSGHSPESPCEKAADIKDEFLQDNEGTNSSSESSGTPFSGFSASTASGGVSDDVSVSESMSSNDSGGSDVHLFDNPLDMLETSFNVKNMNQGKPLLPKFASLVDSVDHLAKSSKRNPTKPDCSDVVGQCASTSSSGLGISHLHVDSIAEPCILSSGFSGSAPDSIGSTSDAPSNSALSNSNGAYNRKFSDSGSVLHFSFNLSESTPLHAQGAKVRGIILDDALPGSSKITKPVGGAVLSENISVGAPKVKKSARLNHDGSRCTDNGTSDSHMLKPREVKSMASSSSYAHLSTSTLRDSISTDAPNVSKLPSSSSGGSKHVANDLGSTSHHLKSREVRCLSSCSSDACLSSSADGHSVPVVKFGKVDGIQAIAALSSQDTSCPNARNGLRTSVRKVVDQFRGSKLSKHYPLGDGCEVAGRYTDKGLFPYEVFVKLYNWNKVELRPCGLINSGNSCYANAVLQCLAFTPPLNSYFLQGIHSRACVNKEACFICEFESLILKAKEEKSPLSPIGILSQLKNVGGQLGNGREEDAHEFLRYAIDTMQSVCLKEAGIPASGSLEEDTTLIGLTFGGYLRSKIKCTKCHGKSERQERMMDLTVEIEGDIGTLEEALHQYTRTEILDGENKYQCSRCQSYERAKKKLTVMEAPNILTIALKRFQSGKFGKLNKPIQFPEILDLAPFTSGTSDKSPIYKLYGVVVHLDIMNASFSGHYVCYVKNNQNKWFKIDDSTVTVVERERVLTKGAYMLLYARCSPRAPRLIRNRIISSDSKNKAIPSWINGKNTASKLRSASARSSAAAAAPNLPQSISTDSSASFESFYSRYPQLQKILEEDSSSDNSSLISNNSDEGSCSTDSTRDSTSTDDLSDFIFGDSGRCWNINSGNPSDSDTSSSSSSSPLCSRHSPLSNSEQQASGLPETSGSRTEGSVPFWLSDTRQSRKLVTSSSYRETDSERLGSNLFHDVNSGIFRKSLRERRDY